MNLPYNRRFFLLASLVLCVIPRPMWAAKEKNSVQSPTIRLQNIERELDGRLGVFALDTGTGRQLSYRANERFPVCSTFKVFAAAAVLARSERDMGLLTEVVRYEKRQLVAHSPITEKCLVTGMTVEGLCAAALQYSDNTAGNLLMRMLGGPKAVTTFARSTGNDTFRLNRWETALNTAIPGDARDTSTPQEMGRSLQRLLLGDALPSAQRDQLKEWLLGNTTGATRIKAGLPAAWKIADKTGGGDYGTANDLAVVWPPHRAPIIIALYTTRHQKDASARNDVLASATRIVVDWLGGRG